MSLIKHTRFKLVEDLLAKVKQGKSVTDFFSLELTFKETVR